MFKKMLKVLLIAVLVMTCSLKSMEIDRSNLLVPSSLGKIKVLHDKNGFHVLKDGEIHHVQNRCVDKEIRNLSDEKLNYFLGNIKDVEIFEQKLTFIRVPECECKIWDIEGLCQEELHLTEGESMNLALDLSSSGYIAVVQLDSGKFRLFARQRIL